MFAHFKDDLSMIAVMLIAAIALWNLIQMRWEFGPNSHRHHWRELLERFRDRRTARSIAMVIWPMTLLGLSVALDTDRSKWQLAANLLCTFWLFWRMSLVLWARASWREVKA